ncbi:MAG: hypothetical protein JO091_12070, partial [Acidobacteriaceae bacterium]|nr:hypothetical protein [Acidobacteriaceae bacterium]
MTESTIQAKAEPAHAQHAALTDAERTLLREHATRTTRSCAWLSPGHRSPRPMQMFRKSIRRLGRLEHELYHLRSGEPSDDLKVLYDSFRLIRTDIQDLHDGTKFLTKLPAVRTPTDESIPRAIVIARALLVATKDRLSEGEFLFFLDAVQRIEPLRLAELGGMLPALKLVLLERIADAGFKALEAFRRHRAEGASYDLARIIASLRLIGEIDWKEHLEQLSLVHRTLSGDPAGVYPRMEFESREAYRQQIERIAAHADIGEIELARRAVQMATDAEIPASAPEALRSRLRHAGYYLLDDAGSQELLHQAGYRPWFGASVQHLLRKYPDEIYIIGIEFVTLMTVVLLLMSLVRTHGGWGLIFSSLLLVIPATQAAVELMNYLATAILTPRPLPKVDFSQGVDASCATMVAIPTLLLNDRQIRDLVADLEVRYLVNRDANIFYALLTDLPDTAEPAGDEDHRVDLARRLIEDLNEKYASEPYGGFYLFHRHRIYNPREGAWMGWERKRGKLLDLNKLLRKVYDPFPVKAGDL